MQEQHIFSITQEQQQHVMTVPVCLTCNGDSACQSTQCAVVGCTVYSHTQLVHLLFHCQGQADTPCTV